MAESRQREAPEAQREASPPPQRPVRALSGPPPVGPCTVVEEAFIKQIAAPRSSALSERSRL
eukprot:11653390-Alexandrium_andersonii.AAC.1